MSDISLKTQVHRRADVLANDVSESETVMLDISGGSYYGLRDVGKAIWDHLATPMTVDRLCERLRGEFDVDVDTCHQETIAFLEKLQDRGLLVVST
ncbi:PqqD family peptide modification chaperone [Granulicoccus sp. GXG6511]|uniref:PqqD family peptide modification chaperone n=1 Tax=Granulicoccus sp. GXG6511 TaxID=3381351 RepID=UPI003D7DF23F